MKKTLSESTCKVYFAFLHYAKQKSASVSEPNEYFRRIEKSKEVDLFWYP